MKKLIAVIISIMFCMISIGCAMAETIWLQSLTEMFQNGKAQLRMQKMKVILYKPEQARGKLYFGRKIQTSSLSFY